jgi:hypothetical protein
MAYRATALVAASLFLATQSFAEPLTDKGNKSNATSRSHSNAISFGAAGINGKTTKTGGTNGLTTADRESARTGIPRDQVMKQTTQPGGSKADKGTTMGDCQPGYTPCDRKQTKQTGGNNADTSKRVVETAFPGRTKVKKIQTGD